MVMHPGALARRPNQLRGAQPGVCYRFRVLGFWGLGFRVLGSGFRVSVTGWGFRASITGLGCVVHVL